MNFNESCNLTFEKYIRALGEVKRINARGGNKREGKKKNQDLVIFRNSGGLV